MSDFQAPSIEYSLLMPMLIVFAVATVGVLVEAFAPRQRRYLIQSVLAVLGVVGALVATIIIGANLPENADHAFGQIAASGAIAVDGPTLFLWGTMLLLALVSLLLFAERHLDGGVSAFAGSAAALPGTRAEQEASRSGMEHTEVYPLMLFALGGMMLFRLEQDFFGGVERVGAALQLLDVRLRLGVRGHRFRDLLSVGRLGLGELGGVDRRTDQRRQALA